jgi:hypothetical protein
VRLEEAACIEVLDPDLEQPLGIIRKLFFCDRVLGAAGERPAQHIARPSILRAACLVPVAFGLRRGIVRHAAILAIYHDAVRANATDELFIHASPEAVQRKLLGLSEDASWWPGARAGGGYGWVTLDVPVGLRRGRIRLKASIPNSREWEGFTWTLEEGDLVGRAEWWLEAFKDGTIVHYFLDAERAPRARRRLSSVLRRHRWAIRRGLNALKDLLEERAKSVPGRQGAR